MTLKQAVQSVIDGSHRFRGYPAYYSVRVTAGWSLIAVEGRHRGSVMGTLDDGGSLHLAGQRAFAQYGGMVRYHRAPYSMHWSGGRWRGHDVWNERTNMSTGRTRRLKP